jgi:hypothetical protein
MLIPYLPETNCSDECSRYPPLCQIAVYSSIFGVPCCKGVACMLHCFPLLIMDGYILTLIDKLGTQLFFLMCTLHWGGGSML